LSIYGVLCGGLLVLNEVSLNYEWSKNLQIAYKESTRAKDIDETLNILLNAIHRIQLTDNFPTDLKSAQLENVRCAAMELCIAIMDYVTLAIKILKNPTIGLFNFELY
jgi:hypothetical protein